jgi:hypothetical protein
MITFAVVNTAIMVFHDKAVEVPPQPFLEMSKTFLASFAL